MKLVPTGLRRLTLLAALVVIVLAALSASAQPTLPGAADLEDGWNRLEPAGAVCAQGEPYAFFVRPADPARLLVYFQGGGACWDRATCGSFGPYDKTVTDVETEIGDHGIFDFADARNAVADYTMIFVSYCSGDVHTGSSTRTVGKDDPLTIHFSGFDHATAVLDWTFANYPDVEQVFVTGTSAGAYGAIFNAWRVFDAYPNAAQYVLGDAGIGVLPPGWAGFDVWDTLANLPAAAGLSDAEREITSTMLDWTLTTYPQAQGAQYTTVADRVQALFYSFMGGDADAWTDGMRASLAQLEGVDRFSAYIAPGTSHGILPGRAFYSLSVEGTPLHAWLANWLAGEPVTSVRCAECS